MSAREVSFEDRMRRFVDKQPNGGCWIWMGARGPLGYGTLRHRARYLRAHRYVYEHMVGPIPRGLVLDHLCRTPSCVNPAHLEPVAQRENVRRGKAGEVNRQRIKSADSCKHGHPFDEVNTRINPRDGKRVCRTCVRLRERRYAAERRSA